MNTEPKSITGVSFEAQLLSIEMAGKELEQPERLEHLMRIIYRTMMENVGDTSTPFEAFIHIINVSPGLLEKLHAFALEVLSLSLRDEAETILKGSGASLN